MFMKNILIVLLLVCSVSLFSQSFDETKLNNQQKQELAILTEDCQKTEVKYRNWKLQSFPVYYDKAQKTTFYVYVKDGHIKTVDLEYYVTSVD